MNLPFSQPCWYMIQHILIASHAALCYTPTFLFNIYITHIWVYQHEDSIFSVNVSQGLLDEMLTTSRDPLPLCASLNRGHITIQTRFHHGVSRNMCQSNDTQLDMVIDDFFLFWQHCRPKCWVEIYVEAGTVGGVWFQAIDKEKRW